MAQITIMKFGGTSLQDGSAFERAAQIVRSCEADRVVVVSAMSGLTNALIDSVRIAAVGRVTEALESLDEHFARHLRVTKRLSSNAQLKMESVVETTQREIAESLTLAVLGKIPTPQLQDLVASYGERLSANLFTIVLEECGLPATYVDARRCIVTNEEYGNAEPVMHETWRRMRGELQPLLDQKRIPVLEGFIGATRRGLTTTLGRGSSNYTATLVCAALGARETQIWTDVTGVLTADPRLVKTARTVPQLSYAEASELARLGARVLHPRMIWPLLQQRIPLRICNSYAPEEEGTLISDRTESSAADVKAIAHGVDLTVIDVASTPTFVANGFMRAIQRIFSRHQRHFDVVGMARDMVSLRCEDGEVLPLIIQDLEEFSSVQIRRDLSTVSFIGEGLQPTAGYLTSFLNILRDLEPSLRWQSTSDINLTSIVDVGCLDSIVQSLHQAIFENGFRSHSLVGQA